MKRQYCVCGCLLDTLYTPLSHFSFIKPERNQISSWILIRILKTEEEIRILITILNLVFFWCNVPYKLSRENCFDQVKKNNNVMTGRKWATWLLLYTSLAETYAYDVMMSHKIFVIQSVFGFTSCAFLFCSSPIW